MNFDYRMGFESNLLYEAQSRFEIEASCRVRDLMVTNFHVWCQEITRRSRVWPDLWSWQDLSSYCLSLLDLSVYTKFLILAVSVTCWHDDFDSCSIAGSCLKTVCSSLICNNSSWVFSFCDHNLNGYEFTVDWHVVSKYPLYVLLHSYFCVLVSILFAATLLPSWQWLWKSVKSLAALSFQTHSTLQSTQV